MSGTEKYEPIKFNSWQELAKYVIDGGKVYFKALDRNYIKVCFSGAGFNCDVERVFAGRDTYIKKQPTLEELIAIKPRLCRAGRRVALIVNAGSIGGFVGDDGEWFNTVEMLTDDEIKQFLDKEPS